MLNKVAVIGAGTMGNGISHVFAVNGFHVKLIDLSQEMLDPDVRHSFKFPAQLESFAIVAGEADRPKLADAESDEVVENRPGGPRLRADADDVMHRQARLDRRFIPTQIDFEIAVEAEVAEHADAQAGVCRGDFRESFERDHFISP